MKTELLFSSYPFLTGDKVTLSRMTDLDLPGLWKILGDEENFLYAPTGPLQSQAECRARLRQADSRFRERRGVSLGVYPKAESNRLAGVIQISQLDRQVESCSLHFVVNRDDTGRGYASSAVRLLTDHLLRGIGVRRIQALVLPNNFRAMTVLERCHFQKEGVIREGFYWPDKGIVDLALYALLPVDLRSPAKGQSYYF